MHGIVCYEHDCRTCAYSRQQFVLYLYYRVVFLTVSVDNGEVEVWLNEVVARDTIYEFPVAHWQNVISVTHIVEFQVSCRVDVQEHIAYVIAVVRCYVMVYKLRVFSRHVGIGEGKYRTF